VLVRDGVAFAAAGIVNYDGTHVFALDATSGRLKWQNSATGHLDPQARTGVSVQGHLLWHDRTLYLAGGNAVSPALFDAATGQCRNDAVALERTANNNVPAATAPRGSELYRLGQRVMVSDKPLYSHPQYPVCDSSVTQHTLVASTADRDFLWINNARVLCVPRVGEPRDERLLTLWRRGQVPDVKPLWEANCESSRAFALCPNAVLVATTNQVVAFDTTDGARRWAQSLPASPVPWGLAVDRDGRVLVALENGQVLAFGRPAALAANQHGPRPAP
jgi:outer membrane protein assembly factor BamB